MYSGAFQSKPFAMLLYLSLISSYRTVPLRDSIKHISDFKYFFFMNHIPQDPLYILLASFQVFSSKIREDIHNSRCSPASTTQVDNEKNV
jgi:hypothetical protein